MRPCGVLGELRIAYIWDWEAVDKDRNRVLRKHRYLCFMFANTVKHNVKEFLIRYLNMMISVKIKSDSIMRFWVC